MQRFTELDFGVPWMMGFFHQDWIYEGEAAADVVAQHLYAAAGVLALRRDARTLLDGLPSQTLEVLWTAGAEYLPSFERMGMTGSEWTRTVVGLCDTWLSRRSDVRPLTGADAEDGWAQRGAVVAEIERAEFLTAEVRDALVECARHCTPDLALRLLLRCALSAPEASLSQDQYDQLEAIGSALHYGEFVVEHVKFLVADH